MTLCLGVGIFFFHEVTSLHPPSFHRNDFSTCNVSNEETTLNITSPDIRFNEYYTAIVSTDGVNSFSHNLKFSECFVCVVTSYTSGKIISMK